MKVPNIYSKLTFITCEKFHQQNKFIIRIHEKPRFKLAV